MNVEIVDSPISESLPEVSFMETKCSSPQPTRHWRVSLAVLLGVLSLAASLVVAGLSVRSHADHPVAPASTLASPIDHPAWYSLGKVDIAGGVTALYPTQPGRVKRINVRENETIKAGQPIFHLEDTVPLLKVRQAETALKVAQRELAIAEAQVNKVQAEIAAQKIAVAVAKKNVDKARILRSKQKDYEKVGVAGNEATLQVAEITVEQAELAVKGEEGKLAIAESGKRIAEEYVSAAQIKIEAVQAQLDEANNAVNECVVRAPVDGTPLRILVNVGETLGSNPHQPAVQFAADRPLLVRAEVEQEFATHVKENQRVVIEDHITGKECGTGKVVSIARWYAPNRNNNPDMLQMNNDVRTLECIVHLESQSPEVRIGQRVRVRFLD
jgi:multidrug resistance efflux pump